MCPPGANENVTKSLCEGPRSQGGHSDIIPSIVLNKAFQCADTTTPRSANRRLNEHTLPAAMQAPHSTAVKKKVLTMLDGTKSRLPIPVAQPFKDGSVGEYGWRYNVAPVTGKHRNSPTRLPVPSRDTNPDDNLRQS
jgi:hypothetical protein